MVIVVLEYQADEMGNPEGKYESGILSSF